MSRRRSGGGMTPLGKFLIFLIVAGAILFGAWKFMDSGALKDMSSKAESKIKEKKIKEKVFKIVLCDFGGYAGGPYFNKGFDENDESEFFTEYGVKVKFVVEQDEKASLQKWKEGEYDLHWYTVGAFSTKYPYYSDVKPKFLFLSDKSVGGDVLVGVRGIRSVKDLNGKKVAVAKSDDGTGNPSLTGLICALKAADMTLEDIHPVYVKTPLDATEMFKSKQVHAAMVWAPDDRVCLKNVPGSKVVTSSKDFNNVIFDGFLVKGDDYDTYKQQYNSIAEGWLKAQGRINGSPAERAKAAEILAKGYNSGLSKNDYISAIKGVRLTTYHDNKNFYGFNAVYTGMTGDKLYKDVAKIYSRNDFDVEGSWSLVSIPDAIQSMDASNFRNPGDKAEKKSKFKKMNVQEAKKTVSIAKQSVNITFPVGSAQLDEAAVTILENDVRPTLQQFESVRVRLEGNTDNTGNKAANVALSRKRAKAIRNYFTEEYGFSKNRFIVIGNGPNNPIASNSSKSGRSKNRRTDIYLLK